MTVAACGDSSSSGNDDTNAPVNPANPDPDPQWVERITVVKHVEGGGFVASDFTMTVTVNGVAQSFPGSETGTTVEVEPGPFEVTEDGPSGYEAEFSGDCSGTVGEGDQKTCVVTNTAIDKCAGVVCVRWAPECGGVGTCNPDTGECEFPDSPEGLPCNDDGNICTIDVCNAEGYCVHPPGNEGTLCRDSAGVCDVAEYCTGESVFCPDDGFLPDDTLCREAEGVCDAAEYCTGEGPACPDDALLPEDTICREAAGICDVAEYCTGERVDCPADQLAPSDTICREAAGVCDVAETCTGESAWCPDDVLVPDDVVCRPSAGVCDVEELCTGQSAECPPDYFAGTDVECRPAVDELCDISEVCTGQSAECPPDVLSPEGIECRPASGDCDVPEVCTGESGACPPDGVAPEGYLCREAAGVCDLAEYCDGELKDCPADVYASGTVCRPSEDACDPAEACSGESVDCPEDMVATCMLCGDKFLDEDGDGLFGAEESGLPDWLIELTNGVSTTASTDAEGRYVFSGLAEGDYVVCEREPMEPGWVQTAPAEICYEVHVPLENAEECELDFGNLCDQDNEWWSKGHWGNADPSIFTEEVRLLLVGLNLRDAAGAHFDPATFDEFSDWILGPVGGNMAYALSQQLAAMALSVHFGYVSPFAVIYAPGTTSADAEGYATVEDVMAEADVELGLHGTASSGDAWLEYQTALKDALDTPEFVNGLCEYSFEDRR